MFSTLFFYILKEKKSKFLLVITKEKFAHELCITPPSALEKIAPVFNITSVYLH